MKLPLRRVPQIFSEPLHVPLIKKRRGDLFSSGGTDISISSWPRGALDDLMHYCTRPNSFPASDIFRCLLISLANSFSLNPDQAQQNIGPDLDPNCMTF